MRTIRTLFLSLTTLVLIGVGYVHAAAPQFDNGNTIDLNNIYSNAQPLTNLFEDTGVYGKLAASSTADVFKVVPDKDGDQTLSLAGKASSSTAQPFLVLVDQTTGTSAKELGIPVPDASYHTSLISAVDGTPTYAEPATFDSYNLYAQQRVSFTKGKTYYLIVFDPTHQLSRYIVRFGDGKVWHASDVFRHIGAWMRVKADNYGGSSPFKFTPSTFGALLYYLAFAVLLGIWLVETIFAFIANRSKMAGFILIKLQKFSRIITWVSLWFVALGGYIYFDAIGWPGIPFVLALIFIPLLAVFLVRTLVFSPKLMRLEVSKQEAVIPMNIQKWMYVMFVLSLVTIGAFLTLTVMLFA